MSDAGDTFAYDHDRVTVRAHFNAEHIIMVRRVNRDVRRVDFRFRLTILGNGVIENALAELNLNILVSKIRDICRGIRAQAKGVSEIELYFGAPTLGGRNFVPSHHGLVERCRRPIAGIAALGGNISMHQADASHPLVGLSGSFAGRAAGLSFGGLRLARLRVDGRFIVSRSRAWKDALRGAAGGRACRASHSA